MERTRSETVVALALMLGGAFGVLVFSYFALSSLATQLAAALLYVPLIVLFGWSNFVGWRLWRATPFGRRWALWLCASQIAVVSLPFVAFDWFTGATLTPLLTIGDTVSMSIKIHAGAAGNYFIGMRDGPVVIGVNLFALWATWMLFPRVYMLSRLASDEAS